MDEQRREDKETTNMLIKKFILNIYCHICDDDVDDDNFIVIFIIIMMLKMMMMVEVIMMIMKIG